MSYRSRLFNHRNAQLPEANDKSFFSKHPENQFPKRQAFFQAKPEVNKPGDQYEKEADSVANAVINYRGRTPALQQKKLSVIQRLATTPEEERDSTNDQRMDRDKEKPFQRMVPDPEKEKKKGIQKMTDAEKEKMKGIQKMDDPMKEEKKKKALPVQKRAAEGATTASPRVLSRIESSGGKGIALPKNTLREMNSSFGVDFSDVHIHKDSDAATMNKELNAIAFTHGNDIYFNEGKYDPERAEGKFLLAHELTHVIQQGFAKEKRHIQRQGDEEEQQTGTVSNDLEIPDSDSDPLGSLAGNLLGGNVSLPSWSTELLSITMLSPNAACIGSASPSRTIPMSICNASSFCTGNFSFKFLFHFDVDLISRPQPFSNAAVQVDLDFIPDGQTTASVSKHDSGPGKYTGAGAPLKLQFENSFAFSSIRDGNLVVSASMFDPASGLTITYSDTIRCTTIPCA